MIKGKAIDAYGNSLNVSAGAILPKVDPSSLTDDQPRRVTRLALDDTVRTDEGDGWTTYGPRPEIIAVDQLAGLLEAVVHHCRAFALVGRKAGFDKLPNKFGLLWNQFCEEHLRQPPTVVGGIIDLITRTLDEELPIPHAMEVARR